MSDSETLGSAIPALERLRGASSSRVLEIQPPGATIQPSYDLNMMLVEDSRGRYRVLWQRIPYQPAGEHRRNIMFGEVAEVDETGLTSVNGRLLVRVEDDGEVTIAPDPRKIGHRLTHIFHRRPR